ncbi:MAG: 50S ribosomal protein L30 [Candidatus Parvarchaeota archaeon]|nr:50S ribosomal protein L30 [Candidatus Jingweiarchaeum tengchongense]MCW1297783.1 50S ribosomal protein L30 [Candidatus Jingweiarchaeum tengchongense]MCW1299793.1 50S ribosomal protein L30 [Candidatus Jingweiarchaeum tengchongense]MCW1304236.1 50S ribosomal protein L30 [Candidatus Jingweiarchaeum tengchongense]MCW1305264.1 50S ribosomal protein L30 [Candidatus Jingweiarchaeum tengchongense]
MKLAAIRIRGSVRAPHDIRYTLKLLGLNKKNSCVILDDDKVNLGMLKKVKDFITWGEINADTLSQLLLKRGYIQKGKRIDREYVKSKVNMEIEEFCKLIIEGKEDIRKLGVKKVFRLKPPSGGFERKGIKVSFKEGGALGYRGEKINVLLKKMI